MEKLYSVSDCKSGVWLRGVSFIGDSVTCLARKSSEDAHELVLTKAVLIIIACDLDFMDKML